MKAIICSGQESYRWGSAAVLLPDVRFPVPASQKVRTISRRYRDGWALRCRCAHVVPPRGAALAAVGRRAADPLPGSAVSLGLKRNAGGQAQRQKKWDLLLSVSTCRLRIRQVLEVRPPFQEKFEARMRSILSSKLAS